MTVMVAFIVLAISVPSDNQCHAMDRPLFIHYILAMVITALLSLALLYNKNKKS